MIHENVILLVHTLNIEETCKDLIAYMVFSTENRDCMLINCIKCPTRKKLKTFLLYKFEEYDADDEKLQLVHVY